MTGAGGSIGAELCRQVAALAPAMLVLFERYENSLYAITNDLTDRFGSLSIRPVIGDVTDSMRVTQVLEQYQPQIVFHAAARTCADGTNPCEAVKTVVGTATRKAPRWYGVSIMISTMAVNSSVMGAKPKGR